MPYDNAWDETVPLGSGDASTTDDLFRQLKLDLKQRLLDAGIDLTQDPVVFDLPTVGAQTGVLLMFGPELIVPLNDEADVQLNDDYFQSEDSTDEGYRMPIALPSGCVVKKSEVLYDKNGAPSITVALKQRTFTTSPAVSTLHNATFSDVGIQLKEVGTTAVEPVGAATYFMHFNNPSGGRFRIYGVRITIDVASLVGYIG